MLPFTQDQFMAVFAAYNEAVWPAPVAAYLLGAAVVLLVLCPRPLAGRLISAILALLWLWTGIAYHWLHFRPINPAAAVFAGAFVAQAGLFLLYGTVLGRLRFPTPGRFRRWAGYGLIGYAMLLYPLLGAAVGHVFPAAPSFGITPCPLTIFSFGLLVLAVAVPWPVIVIPLLWAGVGGSAAVLLEVPEDWMLPAAAVLALILLTHGASNRRRTPSVTDLGGGRRSHHPKP